KLDILIGMNDMEMQELYLNIINNLSDGIYFVDNDRKILFWNKAAEEITGYSAEEIVGKHCQETMLNHIDMDGRPLCAIGCPLFATVIDGKQRKDNVFLRHKRGHRLPICVNIFPMRENGEIIGAIEVFAQNSPMVYNDDLVEHLSDVAMHDALTKLPNRRYLESFLDYKFSEYGRFGREFAVLFADIDGFGSFNNTYGHDLGDKVLANIAQSLQRSVRKNDLVGRWGGEEFLGIYSITQPYDAPIIAEKFRRLVATTDVEHEGESLSVSVSVGVVVVKPEDDVHTLIERADKCMYKSKQAGKNRVTSD
ncbi:sensor domain-containing diguanylate cyclase, partial [Christensenellaceae bacterium OttesenSCG-928-M15]|nr:sensor domain-containing diguanylate cyclase [Christensenellaceae bacterium OttesenSCG-928-M15]